MEKQYSTIQERVLERRRILYGLIPSKGRIIAAGLIDMLFFALIVFLVLSFYLRSPMYGDLLERADSTVIFMGIVFNVLAVGLAYELMVLLTHGTFGMFVARIAYVEGDSGVRFDHWTYWGFLVSAFFINLKYSSLYEAHSFFSSPTCQSKAMAETGTFYVCILAYNKLHKKRQIPFPRD